VGTYTPEHRVDSTAELDGEDKGKNNCGGPRQEGLWNLAPELFASNWIIDKTPHIFDAMPMTSGSGNSALSPSESRCGNYADNRFRRRWCLLPNKQLREFQANSDVDLAVVSEYPSILSGDGCATLELKGMRGQ
jgi:hypothetical protein